MSRIDSGDTTKDQSPPLAGLYVPACRTGQETAVSKPHNTFTLRRVGDKVLYHGDDEGPGVPVRLTWARPLTGRGGVVVLLHADKKEEVATLHATDHLDEASRRIVEQELAQRYFMPKITKVLRTSASFGNRYWHVETDRGARQFLMKSPETNATWITEDRCVLRDTLGNCYEIESFQALDRVSRSLADKVL